MSDPVSPKSPEDRPQLPPPPSDPEKAEAARKTSPREDEGLLPPRSAIDREVADFVRSIPSDRMRGRAQEVFLRLFPLLEKLIMAKAAEMGFPAADVKVDFSTLAKDLMADPKLLNDEDSARFIQYFVDSTANYLVEIHRNCAQEESLGALHSIRFSDGDPHHGKRPCFIDFVKKTPRFMGKFPKTDVRSYAYKPRNMNIEKLCVDHEDSLFRRINTITTTSRFRKRPPLRTREIRDHKDFGLHEFVEGETYDPVIHGKFMPRAKIGARIMQEGFEDGALFEQWLFAEETIKLAGLGNDAHYANFVYNSKEGYPEPIDLEVYDKDSTSSMMPTAEFLLLQELRFMQRKQIPLEPIAAKLGIRRGEQTEEEFVKQIEAAIRDRVAARRAEIRTFLTTHCAGEFTKFHHGVASAHNPHIRYVPISTATLKSMMGFSANEADFVTSIREQLKDELTRDGYTFIPSPEIDKILLECYRKKDIPIFLFSADLSQVTFNGLLIGQKGGEE